MKFNYLFQDTFITLIIILSLVGVIGLCIALFIKFVRHKGDKLETGDWLFSFGLSAIITTMLFGFLAIISE